MALSGTVTTNKYNSTIGLKLTWSGTQNVANNTTTISWTLKSNGGSSGSWWMSGPVTVKIGSKTVLNTTSRFKMYGGGAYKKTGSLTIAHKEDGSQSVAMSVRAAIYSSSVNCTGSNTFTLDKIDRYALITAYENFTDESSPTITYSNPQGAELVTDLKVRVTWNSGANYTSWYNISNWAGGDYTINFSNADRDLMRAATPNANTLAVQFDLQSTMDGSNWHSTKSATMEIVNAAPIMSDDFEFLSGEQYIEDITGSEYTIVQERSTINARSKVAQGAKGASIVSYNLNFAGDNYTPEIRQDQYPVHVTIGHLDIAGGTYPATLTATDSRGNVGSKTINVVVYGWTQPSALYSFERVNDFTTNSAILHVDGKISDVPGTPGNTMLITESHREKGVGNWTTPVTIQDDTDVTISNLNYQKEYELIITVSDSFTRADDPQTNTTYTVTIGKGIPIAFFDALRSSVAVNGIPDDDEQLFVGGTIKMKPNDTDEIVLPHTYSSTEQIVGYWTDGSPIYEMTLQASSDVTVNANSWTSAAFTVSENIIVLDGQAMYYSSQYNMYSIWKFMALQTNTSDKTKIDLYNSRDMSCLVNVLIIRYIKPT